VKGRRNIKRGAALLLILCMIAIMMPTTVFAAEKLPNYTGEWTNFRKNDANMAIVSSPIPITENSAVLKWGVKYGSGWAAAPTPPLIVNGNLYVASKDQVLKIDKETGETILSSEKLAGNVGFALNPMTYAEGMIFVQIGNGRIQALRADTLESLWISEPLGGQTLSPIVYKNGYIYTGSWRDEELDGVYFCLSVEDEDPESPDEEKKATWTLSHLGGFYWAGAYATDNYIVFGSDDGSKEIDSKTAILYSCDPITGEVIDTVKEIEGDIRSSIAYDEMTERLYFTTKSGWLYSIKIDENGVFDENSLKMINNKGMSTGTPVVYNGRAYIGVSGVDQFGPGSSVNVIDVSKLDSGGDMELIYEAKTPGYVQTSALLSTAYENETGKVYIYVTYNAQPGGVYVLEDSEGQMKPKAYPVFTPPSDMQQYGVCSPICDSEGTIYYKNDSGYLMAVAGESRILPLFNDVKEDEWYYDAIMGLVERGIIRGTTEATFRPKANITRAEFVQMLYAMAKKEAGQKDNSISVDPTEVDGNASELFSDVREIDWYAKSIDWAYKNGVVKGIQAENDRLYFSPNEKITRQDMAVMIQKYNQQVGKKNLGKKNEGVKFSDDAKIAVYAKESVDIMQKAGIINGVKDVDGNYKFTPRANATRAEAAMVISNYMNSK